MRTKKVTCPAQANIRQQAVLVYPNPERYEKLTAYYPEPHARGWRGLSLQEFNILHHYERS